MIDRRQAAHTGCLGVGGVVDDRGRGSPGRRASRDSARDRSRHRPRVCSQPSGVSLSTGAANSAVAIASPLPCASAQHHASAAVIACGCMCSGDILRTTRTGTVRRRDRGVELRCELAAERTFEIDEVDDRRDARLLLALDHLGDDRGCTGRDLRERRCRCLSEQHDRERQRGDRWNRRSRRARATAAACARRRRSSPRARSRSDPRSCRACTTRRSRTPGSRSRRSPRPPPPSARTVRSRGRSTNASAIITAKNARPSTGIGTPSGCAHAEARTVAQPDSAQNVGSAAT